MVFSTYYPSFFITLPNKAVIALLNAQSEITHLANKIETNSLQKNSQDEEKFAETLSTIASYLESLARKMEK